MRWKESGGGGDELFATAKRPRDLIHAVHLIVPLRILPVSVHF